MAEPGNAMGLVIRHAKVMAAGSTVRGRAIVGSAALCGSLLVLALSAASTLAANAHVFSTTFGAAGSTPANPYPLSNPTDVAVDNSTGSSAHDAYVTDPANHRVEKFDSSGNFILMFGQGVNQTTTGNVCTAASGNTCQAGTSGSSPGAFTTPSFVAVDGSSGPSAGDVYVGDTGDGLVSKFDSSGDLVASWGNGGQINIGGMAGIAVDPTGNLFAYDGGAMHKYAQAGSAISSFATPRETTNNGIAVDSSDNLYKVAGNPNVEKFADGGADIGQLDAASDAVGLVIDPSNDDLYVDQGSGVINRFTVGCGTNCTPAESFGNGNLNGAQDIGVDASTHIVYAANPSAGSVAVFPVVVLPDAITGVITNPGKTSATLTGHADPAGAGQITACHFEYGTDTSYSTGSLPCLNNSNATVGTPGSPITVSTKVHADLTGLANETIYHYRLVAASAAGTSSGQDHSFETLGPNLSHTLTAYFGAADSTPANPYPLSGPTDVEVDQTSHDLYVTDPANHRVEKFDSSGNFILMFGKGVDQTTGGNVCPVSPADVCQAGASASSTGAFETPTYLAVDNSGGPSDGDVYVADTGDNLVSKFDSSGHLITSWGAGGQKDGSDATDLPVYGPLFGVAVAGPNGNLYIAGHWSGFGNNVWEYTQDGSYQPPFKGTNGAPWLKVDPAGNFYYGAPYGLDPSSEELYQDTGSVVDHYSVDCNPWLNGPCAPVDSFGSGQVSGPMGIAVDGVSHTVYVANSTSGDVAAFGDARPVVTTGEPTGATESSLTLTGHIDPAGRGDITSCHFEYGFDKTYGTTLPCTPDPASSNFTGQTDVTATITGLSPGTRDHYRLVVSNSAGATRQSNDQTFITTQPPAIDGLASANLTATTADLNAQVNPNGLDTTYRFEYGTATTYGQSAPVPDGAIGASNSDQAIGVHLDNLTPNVVYHYRLLAINADGTTAASDHTFNFYPPSCPNENVRQQTQANYLPDCRAYELVSPGDAGGTQLYPGGPNSGYATNPSRLSFTGLFASIPNSGGSPIDSIGDLYVATRTDSGWNTRYVGLPSSQVAVDGGPPMGPPGSAPGPSGGISTLPANGGVSPDKIQNGVFTDPGMDTFLSFNDGNQGIGSSFFDLQNPTPMASNAPFVFSSDGTLLDRWPTNLATVPDGVHTHLDAAGQSVNIEPGGSKALDCPTVTSTKVFAGSPVYNDCPGDVTASADLTHFVFATEWNDFTPDGQLTPPGSVYDNDTFAGTITVASKLANGDPIPAEPTDQAGDPLQIPAVSSDGSHILMAAGGVGPCGQSTCPIPPCSFGGDAAFRCPLQPSHLYMRVDGAVTYDVSQGHYVTYVGASADGSKVYFTSEEQLTPDDTDTSTDLYMWSEATDSLTLVSAGKNGAGNSDSCHSSFTAQCGVVIYSNRSYCQLPSGQGGNCLSDNFIASKNGDIYFFSPEQLDGSRGIPNQENLYDYRNDQVQYVTTLTTGPFCLPGHSSACSDTPLARIQVSPDDSHMAFLTASPVTQYDNAGHLEMYTYEPSTGKITCVSCNPSGDPPTSDVGASQDGLFMANDGRAFFTTNDALVQGDTNNGLDVYEYVEGRPQLITPGTGDAGASAGTAIGTLNSPGLVGVNADGTDVYFSTLETLVPQDHNGLFLKFYDARSGGGFSAPPPPPSCDAADECHAAGSLPPTLPQVTSNGAPALGGNAPPQVARHRKKHHKRSPRHHHSRTTNNRGGSR